MIIERIKQPEFQIKFDYGEGVALAAALKYYAEKHKEAQHRAEWFHQAEQIEKVIYNK